MFIEVDLILVKFVTQERYSSRPFPLCKKLLDILGYMGVKKEGEGLGGSVEI